LNEALPALLVVMVGGGLALAQAVTFSRFELRLLLASFAAHVVAAIAQVVITRAAYGWGDLFGYTLVGQTIAATLRLDFEQYAPEVLKLLFHQVPQIPVEVAGPGSSTGAMAATAGIIAWLTGGGPYTLCLFFGVCAYFGKVALYRAFRESFPERTHRGLLISAMLVPSVVFWSSAVLKEAAAIMGLGYVVLGIVRIRTRAWLSAAMMILVGSTIVALFKAYILFALTLAAGAFLYVGWSGGRSLAVKPIYLAVGAGVAIGGVVGLGRLFPEFSLANFGEQAAYYQEAGQVVSGGSTYSLGDSTKTTLAGQLVFAPFALLSSLFRPFLFEARNAQMLANALETSVILVLAVAVFVRRRPADIWNTVARSPMLMLCLVFALVFAVAVGLTTTNLGTLSRYRMPLVPFLCVLLVVLRHQAPRAAVTGIRPSLRPNAARGGLARSRRD
jgi:hypothetical protein